MKAARQVATDPGLRARPAGLQLDGTVGDGQAEGRTDRAIDQADVAAMSAHELGCDRKPKA